MSEPALLHESIVDTSEIDSLGHLNVRYYVARARKASHALLKLAGVSLREGETVRWTDTFNRFHREQFEGASLQTYGGFISSEGIENKSPGLSRAYFEIRNPDSKTLAASFIVSMHIVDSLGQIVTDLDRIQLTQRSEQYIPLPAHGAPRTLSIRDPGGVTFEHIETLVHQGPTPDMMIGRREFTVLPEDCDAQGKLKEDVDLMHVLHRLQPGQNLTNVGPAILKDNQGRRFSWAMLETRSFRCQRPSANDTVISLGADLSTGEKWRYARRWMFAKESGLLLSVQDSVGICIDLDARKSIVIPPALKSTIDRNCLPQFL